MNGSRFETSVTATNHLYRNNRDGTFTDVTKRAGVERSGWGQGVCAGRLRQRRPHRSVRHILGTQRSVSEYRATEHSQIKLKPPVCGARAIAGAAGAHFSTTIATDCLICSSRTTSTSTSRVHQSRAPVANCRYMGLAVNCGPRGLKGESNLLFHNEGGGKFVDVSEKSGISKARDHYGLGVLVADFDNDEWPDVYVANDKTASLLFRNKHDGTFEEAGVFSGVAYDPDGKVTSGMGVAAADFDRDGLLDILKTNFTDEATSLYRNSKEGLFVDESAAFRIGLNRNWVGWGAGFADFDNDGWPDILLVNGHVFPELDTAKVPFRSASRACCTETSTASGSKTYPAKAGAVNHRAASRDEAPRSAISIMTAASMS